jgi:hypothetical protein
MSLLHVPEDIDDLYLGNFTSESPKKEDISPLEALAAEEGLEPARKLTNPEHVSIFKPKFHALFIEIILRKCLLQKITWQTSRPKWLLHNLRRLRCL